MGSKDSKDINDKMILTAVALDKKDDLVYIYVEIANIEYGTNTEGQSGGEAKKYVYVKAKGKSIPEARENLDRKLNRPTYLSAIRTILMTREFANEHLVEYFYRIRSEELYRKKVATVVVDSDIEELFENSNQKEMSVGFAIEEMLKNLEDIGTDFSKPTLAMIENVSGKYSSFLIPTIALEEGENSLIGYSVVDDITINGFIEVEEAKGVSFFKAKKPQFYYMVNYNENNLTIEVNLKKRSITPKSGSKEISFDVKMDFDASIMYGNKKTPYGFDKSDNEKITDILTALLKEELESTIERSQKDFKCDYLQFHDEFRIKYPSKFEKIDWGKEFVNAKVNISVKVDLSESWMMDYKTDERK
jgi:Ger(x)C family germination protein